MKEFDDNDAIKFIRNDVPAAQAISEDDLLLVVDTMFDYFESLDDDAPDEAFDEAAIVAYVQKQLKKDDENKVPADMVPAIVTAELNYEDTLDD
ncbi:MAG: hypothetical protein KBT09_02365 [Bacteroidales bacterium]|nr:hypothetical protein [Candidatus Sodaliphilus fimicaballi]